MNKQEAVLTVLKRQMPALEAAVLADRFTIHQDISLFTEEACEEALELLRLTEATSNEVIRVKAQHNDETWARIRDQARDLPEFKSLNTRCRLLREIVIKNKKPELFKKHPAATSKEPPQKKGRGKSSKTSR